MNGKPTSKLVPVAIELASSNKPNSDYPSPWTVYTPNDPAPIWRLAKIVFASVGEQTKLCSIVIMLHDHTCAPMMMMMVMMLES